MPRPARVRRRFGALRYGHQWSVSTGPTGWKAVPAFQHLHRRGVHQDVQPGLREVLAGIGDMQPAMFWARSASSRCDTALSGMDLSAPLALTKAWLSPRCTSQLMPCNAARAD